MLVSFWNPSALEHPGRPLCEATRARPRNIAPVLLHDAQPRTFTDDTNFSHILYQFPGPDDSKPDMQVDDCQYTSIGAVFDVTLYIQSR